MDRLYAAKRGEEFKQEGAEFVGELVSHLLCYLCFLLFIQSQIPNPPSEILPSGSPRLLVAFLERGFAG
jgi:hypothetical protein